MIFTPIAASDWSPSTTPQIIVLSYSLAAGNNYSLEITDGSSYDNALAYVSPFPSPFPITNGAVIITGGIDNGFVDTYSYNYFFDWDITEVCSSAREAVTATVLTAEECNLGIASNSDSLASIVAAPNPYNDTFKLSIQSSTLSDVDIKMYDMIGRLIQNYSNIPYNEVVNLELGSELPSGIYTILVKQDDKSKSIQVIKK